MPPINGPINGAAWKNNFGTVPLQFEQWQPYDWQYNGGSQVQLENYAAGHEMSNQQSEKQSFANTKLDCIRKTGG